MLDLQRWGGFDGNYPATTPTAGREPLALHRVRVSGEWGASGLLWGLWGAEEVMRNNKSRNREIRDRFGDGASRKVLAAEYGVSYSTILSATSQHAQAVQVVPRSGPLSAELRAEIAAARAEAAHVPLYRGRE